MMNISPPLFPLTSINPRLIDYYFDKDMNIWSGKNKNKPIRRLKMQPRIRLSGLSYDVLNLRSACYALHAWDVFFKEAVDMTSKHVVLPIDLTNLKNSGFIIALLKEGKLKFSTNPKVHYSEHSAKTEVERLARDHPGEQFAYFKCMGIGTQPSGLTWI